MPLELISLDPPEVATGRTELALHLDAIQGAESGPDWGDAAIESYLADAAWGSLPVDFRVPNRTVEIPLLVGAVAGAMTFDQARAALQQKAALLQREGGWLKRVLRDGRTVYLDVIEATLKLGGGTLQAQRDFDPNAVLTLQTLPDWYGDEEDLGAIASASPHLIFTLPAVRGDHPARTRIVVTDGSGQAQRGLLWGLRSRHYSAASTAALAYQAEALTPLDAAAAATVSGTAVIRHASLSTGWTPVLSTQLSGGGHLTHTGSYRVWARVHTTSATAPTGPRVRLVWDVGDLVAPVENPAVSVPGTNAFCLVNLGTIRLDAPPVGTHRWQGAIQATSAEAGDNVSIDRVWLMPVDEGYGELRAPVLVGNGPGLAGYSARDEFGQTAGALTGKALPVGGSWAYLTGEAEDFTVDATDHVATRSHLGAPPGRLIGAGTATPTTVVVQVDVMLSAAPAVDEVVKSALIVRYVDASNYAKLTLGVASDGSTSLALDAVLDPDGEGIAVKALPGVNVIGQWYTMRLSVDAAGGVFGWLVPQGSTPGEPVISGSHSALATGGALATGRIGIADLYWGATGTTVRKYDNFAAWVPAFDAVLNPGLAVELRSDGMFRQAADGGAYGPVSHVIGDLPRLPASGMEDRVTEVILKPSRGAPGTDLDPAADAIGAHVYARPSWLFVPET